MTTTAIPLSRPAGAKREAILEAALRLIARTGLHNTPMSAIAREAGVAAGTPYLYFASKEELINALYLEVAEGRDREVLTAVDVALPAREQLWRSWQRFASWHLEHRDASNFIHQCESSAILTGETRARYLALREHGLESFSAGVRAGQLRDLPIEVFYSLFAGPVFVLAHMRDKQEIEVSEEILRLTFEGVARGVLA
jgi:AcrR family transcriptional regulator